ncbi:MAG: coproporphyrinogen III oxidase [Alphaproteobacteria bacterium]|nr:coproporphyrinogen III oxidase [Alphaproteobacteria bacterium]
MQNNGAEDEALALYVHWPFCLSRCPYCDFNAHVRDTIDQTRWHDALLTELSYWAKQTPGRTLTSIFFGGGTPSLMDPATTGAVINSAANHWEFADDIEITLEANPTSIEAAKFADLRAAGVNRVSIGVQALDDEALKFLGRGHDRDQALTALNLAEKIFPRFSFDLIYARPQQTADSWASELREALSFAGDHLSLYQLTIEKGTPFFTEERAGAFTLPEEDNAAALFDITQEICDQHGLPAYEISNHAQPGSECRHNLTYWEGGDYIGTGPGGHGRLTIDNTVYATEQIPGPENWLEEVETSGHATRQRTAIDAEGRVEEIFMMGLRLSNGLSREIFWAQTGMELEDALEPRRLRPLLTENYLVLDSKGIRTTAEGRLRLNAILAALLT